MNIFSFLNLICFRVYSGFGMRVIIYSINKCVLSLLVIIKLTKRKLKLFFTGNRFLIFPSSIHRTSTNSRSRFHIISQLVDSTLAWESDWFTCTTYYNKIGLNLRSFNSVIYKNAWRSTIRYYEKETKPRGNFIVNIFGNFRLSLTLSQRGLLVAQEA